MDTKNRLLKDIIKVCGELNIVVKFKGGYSDKRFLGCAIELLTSNKIAHLYLAQPDSFNEVLLDSLSFVLFYKDEYFYQSIFSPYDVKRPLKLFLENGFEERTECILCYEKSDSKISCQCGKDICLDCFSKVSKCPYCRTENLIELPINA